MTRAHASEDRLEALARPDKWYLAAGDGPRRLWDVPKGPAGLAVRVAGRLLLEADAPVVLRQVVLAQGRLHAQAHAPRPATLTFRAAGPCVSSPSAATKPCRWT